MFQLKTILWFEELFYLFMNIRQDYGHTALSSPYNHETCFVCYVILTTIIIIIIIISTILTIM